MKVVAIYGGPRKNGNTLVLLQEVLDEVQKAGATTEVFSLNQLNFRGCQSCYGCVRNGTCVIKDDAQKVLAAVAEADRIILATPVYMWDMTGQLKLFIDRLFSFLNPEDHTSKLAPGKKVLWTVTQGQLDPNKFRDVFDRHGKMMEFLGFGENKVFIAGGLANPGEIKKQPQVLADARKMVAWLLK